MTTKRTADAALQPVFRFAPSPNGQLHLGHAFSALTNARLARRFGGRLLVRIEDIDTARCPPAFIAACLDDLAWLGLEWEEPERRQSRHFADYEAALNELRDRELVYPCFCSRREIVERVVAIEAETGTPWPRDPEGTPLYPGTCRGLPPERVAALFAGHAPHSWRLDMGKALKVASELVDRQLVWRQFDPNSATVAEVEADPARWGDIVLARKDTPTSYHLAVVVDDAIQGVTHVVRGQDLQAATDIHVLLQALLGKPSPLYHHHALLRDAAGEKLAKSRGSRSLSDMRARGVSAAELRQMLGFEDHS